MRVIQQLLATYGGQRILLPIGVNTRNFNVRTAAMAAGWGGSLPFVGIITVAPGIIVGSTSTSTYAFDTDLSFPAGTVLLMSIASGAYIVGMGGQGGQGSDTTVYQNRQAPGSVGGNAFHAQWPITITNNGTIGGGGGGGGGGGSSAQVGSPGAGGGGGAGDQVGPGAITYGNSPGGSNGALTTGGNGGSAWSTGGTGGSLGNAGQSGSTSGYWGGSCAGGAAGLCVVGNSNINWLVTGTRLGSIT
jgi:hypothetical protein